MKTVRFQVQELLGIGMALVVLGIGLGYGLQVMGETKADIDKDVCTDNSYTYNETSGQCINGTTNEFTVSSNESVAVGDAIVGVAKIPNKMPTIVTVIVASVIIGILMTYLWARFK